MRNLLLVSVGLAPQVVTGTVWALAVAEDPPWVPDELHLLTTAEGAARLAPLGPALSGLADRFSIPALATLWPPAGVTTVADDPEDLEALADRTTALVAALTARADTRLHASIAGGRKPAAALLALAMALHGRPDDRMSHVVADPDLERRPDYWCPGTRVSREVLLWDVPFPRLRMLVPADTRARSGFRALVAAAEASIVPSRLVVYTDRRMLTLGRTEIRPPPVLGAWVTALAADKVDGGEGLPRIRTPHSAVARWYVRWTGRAGPAGWADPIDAERLEEWSSRANKLVAPFLGGPTVRALIERSGPRSAGRYRIGDWISEVSIVCDEPAPGAAHDRRDGDRSLPA